MKVDHREDALEIGVSMVIKDCIFEVITTDTVVINDNAFKANVKIFNTDIDILFGSFYISRHLITSYIHVKNLLITSNQLNSNNMNKNNNGLFELSTADIVLMEDIDILYSYNIMDNCNLYAMWPWMYWFHSYYCKNPKTFLINYGELTMNFINVDIHIYPDNITHTNSLVVYKYEISAVNDMSFIINDGDMNIINILINKTISHVFIANLGSLYAESVSFSSSFSDLYQPNDLHSTQNLLQTADDSFTKLTQSYFVGSQCILTVLGGGATITDSVFEKNDRIIDANAANSILIKNCTFSTMELETNTYFFMLLQVNKKYFIIISYI